MKRLVHLVIAILMLGSKPALAQTNCKIAFGAKFMKPAAIALEIVASYCGYELVYEKASDVPQAIMNLDGRKYDTVDSAIIDITKDIQFKGEIDREKKTIVVSRKNQTSVPADVDRSASQTQALQVPQTHNRVDISCLLALDPNLAARTVMANASTMAEANRSLEELTIAMKRYRPFNPLNDPGYSIYGNCPTVRIP